MSLTHEIIQQHKGLIEVESEVGEGTTFTVTLCLGDRHFTDEQKVTEPLPVEPLPMQPMKPEDAVLLPDRPDLPEMIVQETDTSLSVLLVEDNEDLLQVLEEAFSIKYKVYKATDGEEGIRIADMEQPDLIISDVMMPGLSGIAMCQRLKRKLDISYPDRPADSPYRLGKCPGRS